MMSLLLRKFIPSISQVQTENALGKRHFPVCLFVKCTINAESLKRLPSVIDSARQGASKGRKESKDLENMNVSDWHCVDVCFIWAVPGAGLIQS